MFNLRPSAVNRENYFPIEAESDASGAVATSSIIRKYPLRFTRCLFAQLTSQRFYPRKASRWNSIQLRAAQRESGDGNDAVACGDVATAKSIELGFKVCAGLEILFTEARAAKVKAKRDAERGADGTDNADSAHALGGEGAYLKAPPSLLADAQWTALAAKLGAEADEALASEALEKLLIMIREWASLYYNGSQSKKKQMFLKESEI